MKLVLSEFLSFNFEYFPEINSINKMAITVAFVFFQLVYCYLIADHSKQEVISPSTANALETGVDYLFFMEIEQGISVGDYLIIVFPSEYADINLGTDKTCHINDMPHLCSAEDTNTAKITIATLIPAISRLRVHIPNISNPTTAISTSYFKVYSERALGSQIIDMNDAFGTIGFASAISPMVGSISLDTGSTATIAMTSNYVFKFTLTSAVPINSVFTISIPSPFSATITSACSAVAYSNSVSAISGSYSCTIDKGLAMISGLGTTLSASQNVAFKISNIQNPSYKVSSGVGNFIIQSVMPHSTIVIDRATVGSPSISSGTLTAVTHVPYTSDSKFSDGNSLYTIVKFKTQTKIPEGGSIEIDYYTTVESDKCIV